MNILNNTNKNKNKQMNIKQIKNNYQYKYRFIDINKLGEIYGYIYNVNDEQYFINDKETYFKIIDSV